MKDCAPRDTPITKDDKFSLFHCPRNELENKEMEKIPYASAVGSIMYAQVLYVSGYSVHSWNAWHIS